MMTYLFREGCLSKMLDIPFNYTDWMSRENITAALGKDELVREHLQKEKECYRRGIPFILRTMTDVLGEQRVIAALIANNMLQLLPQATRMPSEKECALAALAVLSAPAFFWKQEILLLARETELPDHVVGAHLMPFPLMYWSFDSAIKLESKRIDALLVFINLDGHLVIDEIGSLDGGYRTGFLNRTAEHVFGQKYSELSKGGKGMVRFLTFMNSKLAVKNEQCLPRHYRKRQKTKWNQDVSVITLRQYEKSSLHRDSTEHQKREWACRWLVRGHWRAQWYPSKQAHEVIWIDNYMKGPDEKPTRERVYKLAR